MAETFAVPVRGVGKPDYSQEISSGQTRPGFRTKFGETLKCFALAAGPGYSPSPFPWGRDVIPAGGTVSMVDAETGLSMPFTVPIGYTLDIFNYTVKASQDVRAWIELDGSPFVEVSRTSGGDQVFIAELVEKGTSIIDPLGAISYQFDIKIENRGGADMELGAAFYAFLSAVGTEPLPTVKTVRCKFCSHEEVVPQETTRWICPTCGELNLFYDLSRLRGSK